MHPPRYAILCAQLFDSTIDISVTRIGCCISVKEMCAKLCVVCTEYNHCVHQQKFKRLWMQLWMLKYCYNVASILTLLINQCLELLFHFDFRDTMIPWRLKTKNGRNIQFLLTKIQKLGNRKKTRIFPWKLLKIKLVARLK